MDNDRLKNELIQILRIYYAEDVRYQHLAFSSRELAVLSQLSLSLRELLPDYSVWTGDAAATDNAPYSLCSRHEFINAAFKEPHQGLIITQPNFWLQRWTNLDKQAFLSALSSRHGGHNIIVIFPESDEFKRLNLNYFTPKPIDNLPVTLWASSKKQLF